MNKIKCPCGKRARVQHVSGYWWEIYCKHCGRYVYGGADELEIRVKWLRGEFEKRGKVGVSDIRKAMERAEVHYTAIKRLTSKNT